jgi:hypothetical protein
MPEPADRRAAERFPVSAGAGCPFVAPVAEAFGSSRLKEVSMAGVGLLAGRRVEPGTLLAVTLANPARRFSKTVLVRVAHCSPASGGYLVGGTFDAPLTYQELTALVL